MTGKWPAVEVDHKDVNGLNDAWANLRLATHGENSRNTKLRRHSGSGLKCVYYEKSRKKWLAYITINKKRVVIGRFDCPAAASFAYQIAANKYHGEFARAA
jgi:hypothetical protein